MRARATLLVLLPLIAAVPACGPVPVAQAEASCLRDAELAARPRGSVTMGVGAGRGGFTGGFGRVEVDISSDYVAGRDPSDVFNRCVVRRSGQIPTRPLYDQPGWRG
ncbi:hypothetical protein [Paracoccus stylophorae]|uniref:hypothetical protein n=1 Tax=Paracoccus stylophorae TaxID=659350 RepID=UPI002350EF32|nr:hypothetical protein [Paracoccus stylophorae]